MEIDESQLKELRAVQLDTLKFLFKDIDGKTIEQEFERCTIIMWTFASKLNFIKKCYNFNY